MAKKKRDYKAEYQRRIERGLTKGLTRSQARGHAKAGEKVAGKARKPVQADEKLEDAYKALRRGTSLSKAAKKARVSRERLSRFVVQEGLAKWDKRKWVVTDKRPRRIPIISKGKQLEIIVAKLKDAVRAGAYWDAQARLVRSNDVSLLKPFKGKGVTDIKGKFYPFETDPNALHRLASMEGPVFHEIYQISAN